jgi:hypothetical protein
VGVLVWKSNEKKMFFVVESGLEQVKQILANRRSTQEK